eukprot:8170239-Ditylum_brightwellii.AAC.1
MQQNQAATTLLAHSICEDQYTQYSDTAIYCKIFKYSHEASTNETHHQAKCPVPNCTLTTSTGITQKNVNIKEDLFSSKKTKMQVPVFMQTLQDHFIKFHILMVVHGKTPL